jgi:hypothetical protein
MQVWCTYSEQAAWREILRTLYVIMAGNAFISAFRYWRVANDLCDERPPEPTVPRGTFARVVYVIWTLFFWNQ